MPRPPRTPVWPALIGVGILAWVALQWYEHAESRWFLHTVNRRGFIWTNRAGDALVVSAAGEEVTGYRLVPARDRLMVHPVAVTYEPDSRPLLLPNPGTGNLFEDLNPDGGEDTPAGVP
jgi:hypothetical protein